MAIAAIPASNPVNAAQSGTTANTQRNPNTSARIAAQAQDTVTLSAAAKAKQAAAASGDKDHDGDSR